MNELLKGGILFCAIGLIYFLFVLLIEYFLWLPSLWRTFLFWIFVGVEAALLVRFFLIPFLKLLKLSKGMDEEEAARLVGKHFPEVGDKLVNILQLKRNKEKSDLLLAGIEQKSLELQPVPFLAAVDFKASMRYLKYAALPILIILVAVVSGNGKLFADSYTRVVNYKTTYTPPPPFHFVIGNNKLEGLEGEQFTLEVETLGKVRPEEVMLLLDNESYFMGVANPGSFEYTFEQLSSNVTFTLSANGMISGPYVLEVVEVPRLNDFRMYLDYPSYTNRRDEEINGSGNAEIPVGTEVTWKVSTVATKKVSFIKQDSIFGMQGDGREFSYTEQLMKDLTYGMSTSNDRVEDYERLNYNLEVIPDEYPKLDLEHKQDSLEIEQLYFHGIASDDYGVSRIDLVYRPINSLEESKRVNLGRPGADLQEFYASFPDSLSLKEGTTYEVFFQVLDNDAVHGAKRIESPVFLYRKKSVEEKEEVRQRNRKEAVDGFEGILGEMELAKEELLEMNRLQKEKDQLDYSDRKKLENVIKRQREQNRLMEQQSEKFKRNLGENESSEEDGAKKDLEKRLAEHEQGLTEKEELLRELEEMNKKLEEEGLSEMMEKLSQKSRHQERSMEQILELTKRYYVEEKLKKLANDLETLSEEQEEISEEGVDGQGKQDSLEEAFQGVREELDEVEEENKKLRSPMDLGRNRDLEEEIGKELENAAEKLKDGKTNEAKENQKKAAEKLRKLSAVMQEKRAGAAMEMLQEDSESLRQVLDNLVVFSFGQEELLEDFKTMERNDPLFGEKIRNQNRLRENFEYVDDSLFALAARNPGFSEEVTELVIYIQDDLQMALERFSQNQLSRGMGSQQYVITNANELALLLNRILENMRDMLNSSPGSSEGRGEQQLSDIIQGQKKLNEEMEKGLEKKQRNRSSGEEGNGEENSGRLFEIFKEQQRLREALKKELESGSSSREGEELEEDMQKIEEELLDKGLEEETLNRMRQLEDKLMDFEEAEMRRNQSPERDAKSNEKEFNNPVENAIPEAKDYFERNEILNRQSLPLRGIYQRKVRNYFGRGED